MLSRRVYCAVLYWRPVSIHTASELFRDEKLFKFKTRIEDNEIHIKTKQIVDLIAKGKKTTVKMIPSRGASDEETKEKLSLVKKSLLDEATEKEIQIQFKEKPGHQLEIIKEDQIT